jgi:hypothetical protein
MKPPFKADPRDVMKYSDAILEVVDNQDEFTRSDLQGAIEAVMMNILIDVQKKYYKKSIQK